MIEISRGTADQLSGQGIMFDDMSGQHFLLIQGNIFLIRDDLNVKEKEELFKDELSGAAILRADDSSSRS